ncbi:MAG: hypothetical protein QG656_1669 [Candidatus Hydrogenedentes bacterium]|nr:hypothetical protein [Candidatus Hydrogenedentota bacterium]
MSEKILFVDDDPRIVECYKRAFEKTFDIDIASTGADGLALLAERGPYAVVVADMLMPGMNGSEFLAHVRDEAPETVRMVLTGQTDIQTALDAVNQGHVFRFLTKPCQMDTMLAALQAGVNEYRQTAVKKESLEVTPAHARDTAPWTISLGPDNLTLINARGAPVIEMFREEAARYMRFDHALFRGTILTISVIPGLKGYTFLCGKEQMAALLAWLPHKTPEEVRKEVRYSGIAVGLLGVLQLILPQGPFWGWGVLLLLAGVFGVAFPRRRAYFVNVPVMLLAALADFIAASPSSVHPAAVWSPAPLAPVFVGGMLFLWAAHQILLTSPNQHLRTVRALRDKRSDFLPACSPIVESIGHAIRWISLVFAAYAGAVTIALFTYPDAPGEAGSPRSMLPDLAVFGVLTVLLIAIAALIALRKRPAYAEAKVAGQLVISVLVLAFWSVLLNFDPHNPVSFFGHVFAPSLLVFERPYEWVSLSFFGGLLSKELAIYARPYVWISLVLCVLLFNHAFTRRVDDELEEQRGEVIP